MSLTDLPGAGAGAVGVESAAIRGVEAEMIASIGQLKTAVNSVATAAGDAAKGWQGDAGDKFRKVAKDWEDEAANLNTKLDLFQQAVESARATLETMDQA
ncbi:WXG100 family type VII secretion target [Nocardia sp. NPDC057353]|uniref:WXG100 family type VII secretion target n=1 Tax=Nocardia sp. NPDC057353 TaxID=3346104 RepID=UPI0036290BC7